MAGEHMDNVLLVEDDKAIAELVTDNLVEQKIEVTHVETGEKAIELVEQGGFSVVLLDVMLPGKSGLDVCRELREKRPELSIIMVTSRNSEIDRVLGLELGADDYLTKPFSIRELQARVRSQLRRCHVYSDMVSSCQQQSEEPKSLEIGSLHIDTNSHKTMLDGRALDLTSTEFDLLLYLASHPEQVFSREQLLSSVWGYHHSGYEHTVNSHINRLRNKLERDVTNPEIVQTVWGVGYKFNRQGVSA